MLEKVNIFRRNGFDVEYELSYERVQLSAFDKDDKLFLVFFQTIDNFMRQSPEIMVANLEDLEHIIYQYSDYINTMNKRVNWQQRYSIQFWAGGLTVDLIKAIEKFYSRDEYDRYLNQNYIEVLEDCNFNCLLINGRTSEKDY